MSNKSKKEGIAELVEGLGHYKLECKKQAKVLKLARNENKLMGKHIAELREKDFNKSKKIDLLKLRNQKLLEALREGTSPELQKETLQAIEKEMQEEEEAEEKNNNSCCPNHLRVIELMQRFKPEN